MGEQMGRKFKKWLLILPLVVMLLFPAVAYAMDDPDQIEIKSVEVFRNLNETGDFTVIFHYNLEYGTLPDDAADDTFLFQLWSPGLASLLGSNTPFPYFHSGYDHGAGSLHFDAASSPTWEAANVLRIVGNPAYFTDPPTLDYALQTGDYDTSENQTAAADSCGNYVIDILQALEIQYDTDLTLAMETGTVLNGVGESYSRSAIPGLQAMAPQIFFIQETAVSYDDRTWATTQADIYEERYASTSFGAMLNRLGTLFGGISGQMVFSFTFIAGAIGCLAISEIKFKTATHGLIAGSLILLAGALMGGIPMSLRAIMALIAALMVGYLLFFRSS